MIGLIILIALVVLGVYLANKTDYDTLGFIMCAIFGSWIILHSVALWGVM